MAETAEDTRFAVQHERLLKAAARCFNDKGYSGTSLKDVAQHLGLTDAALYYYVRNKEELVFQCYLRAARLGAEAMHDAVRASASGLDQAYLYVQNHVRIMTGERGPVAIMSEVPSLNRAHREEVLALSRRHSREFEKILARGIDDGSIDDCDIRMTGNAIMGALNWIPKWFHGDPHMAAQIVRKFPVTLTRGLRSGGPG